MRAWLEKAAEREEKQGEGTQCPCATGEYSIVASARNHASFEIVENSRDAEVVDILEIDTCHFADGALLGFFEWDEFNVGASIRLGFDCCGSLNAIRVLQHSYSPCFDAVNVYGYVITRCCDTVFVPEQLFA